MKTTILLITIIFTFNLHAHPGGTKRSGFLTGCHNDKKANNFHCHSKSPFNGKSFESDIAAMVYAEKYYSQKGKKKIESGRWRAEGETFAGAKVVAEGAQGASSRKLRRQRPRLSKEEGVSSQGKSYVRGDWKHWIDRDSDCQDERAEFLIRESLIPVKLDKKGCLVKSGKWKDFYYDEVLTDASKIDIDHVVPLKHAFDHGGALWTRAKKEKFANDPLNMVITNLKYNRSKGPKSISEWVPINFNYACKYAKRWMGIKKKYKLSIKKSEVEAVDPKKCR